MYPIESKSDLTGAMLVIRFPEEDLDAKALYTIQADQPDFLIPFRCRTVDGEVECTYQLGTRIKLLYRCSSRDPGELTGFWGKVLQPLLDCGDWFLKPFSFVLDPQYLYTNRDGDNVSYLYVPSKRDCADMEALRSMAADLAQKNPSSDAELEVKVLRAIMQGFQPQAFLQMLRKNQPAILAQSLAAEPAHAGPIHAAPVSQPPAQPEPPQPAPQPDPQPVQQSDDIFINIPSDGKPAKKGGGLFGGGKKKKGKPEKQSKPNKSGGLFGWKAETPKDPPQENEIMLGAAAAPPPSSTPKPAPAYPSYSAPTVPPSMDEDEETKVDNTFFRLVGDQRLPQQILIALEPGGVFTIGRFDTTVGRQQASFEFGAKTKAISRHHAAIERRADGSYTVTDLDSTAGTFVDGARLTPNVPHPLVRGNRVSFGTAGADYIWEDIGEEY